MATMHILHFYGALFMCTLAMRPQNANNYMNGGGGISGCEGWSAYSNHLECLVMFTGSPQEKYSGVDQRFSPHLKTSGYTF